MPVSLRLALAVLLLPAVAAAQAPCQPIRFAAGTSAGVITAEAPADDSLCYSLKVGAGQRAQLRVESLSPASVAATIPGVGDAQEAFAWTTRAGTYEINVFQMFRAVDPAPFRLHLSVSGG